MIFRDLNPYHGCTSFCSSCGVCEMYSCPQSLAPRSLAGRYERRAYERLASDLRRAYSRSRYRNPENIVKFLKNDLMARLGLTKYDKDAPLNEELSYRLQKVKILTEPAYRSTCPGNCQRLVIRLTRGQMIAAACTGLKCRNPCL